MASLTPEKAPKEFPLTFIQPLLTNLKPSALQRKKQNPTKTNQKGSNQPKPGLYSGEGFNALFSTSAQSCLSPCSSRRSLRRAWESCASQPAQPEWDTPAEPALSPPPQPSHKAIRAAVRSASLLCCSGLQGSSRFTSRPFPPHTAQWLNRKSPLDVFKAP